MGILCLNTAHSVLFLYDTRRTFRIEHVVLMVLLEIHFNRFSELIFFPRGRTGSLKQTRQQQVAFEQ